MKDFLTQLALAHQKHEGYGTKNAFTITKHNNPGALRWHPGQRVFGGQKHRAFTIFPNYNLGFQALKADLRAKITGHSQWIDYSNNPTLLDYIKVYAPSSDNNYPVGYAQAVIADLPKYKLSLSTPLENMARLITGKRTVFNRMSDTLRRIVDRVAARKRARLTGRFNSRTLSGKERPLHNRS